MREQYRCSCGRSWLMVSRNAKYRASNFPVSSMAVCLAPRVPRNLFFRVWLAFSGGDQAPQTAVDVGTPGVGADVEALVFWDQTKVSEANLGFIPLLGDLKTDFRVLPLGLVLS